MGDDGDAKEARLYERMRLFQKRFNVYRDLLGIFGVRHGNSSTHDYF